MTTINLSSSMNWTGFLAPSSATGPNGDSASINYDTLARPYSSVSPYGATTTYAYNDTVPARTVSTNGHWTKTTADGFGRTIKAETGDAGGTKSTVDTVYDSCGCNPLGKVVKTSMPYAPNGTVYWKQYTYDGLGRTVSATEADGTSTTTYAYQGNTVQVTDPAGKWKKFTMDAFGNLTSVLEPDPLNQPSGTLTTAYAYDVLNHLTTVTMPRATGTQTRTFNYTTGTTVGTLLLSATNPENGTVIYTYNTDKTLATKTDALNQQFSYTYDSYKRVTQINLGQTVIRQFYYDTNPFDGTFSQNIAGRLAAIQNAPTANADTFIEMYSYTQPGEVRKKRLRMNRTVQSHALTIDLDAQYSYDNEGKMTSVTYPQSSYIDPNTLQVQPSPVTTYTYAFDTMGRPTSMTGPGVDGWGNPATVNIVNGVQYGPASELLQMSYFGSNETRQYNTRLQMTHLTVPGQLNITYNFAAQNNSQISSQTDNLSGEQVTYQYDALQRLYSASTSAWSQNFTYDGFGNLTDKIGTGGAPTNHLPANAATNQLTGYSFDANGNVTSTGFGWDPENRMSYATWGGTQYAYDSANKRVWTGNYSCPGGFCGPGYGWQFQSETVFFYGIDGKQLASHTPQVKYSYGTPQYIYYLLGEGRVYFKSKYVGNANTSLMSGGTAIGQDRAGSVGKYFPYGEDRSGAPNDTVKFATYTRDSATGLDYADQRYYTGGVGRFMSPDPYQASGGTSDPTNWNRYAYTRGDPVNANDSSGRDYCLIGIYIAPDDVDYCGMPFPRDCGPYAYLAPFTSDVCIPLIVLPALLFARVLPPPYALWLVDDCYDRSVQAFALSGGAPIRRRQYRVVADAKGTPYELSTGVVEVNLTIQGNAIATNSNFGIVPPRGSFFDYITAGAGQETNKDGHKALQILQAFVGVAPGTGSLFPFGLYVVEPNNPFGTTYGSLGIYADEQRVIINNVDIKNRDGTRHFCDQPALQ